MNVRRRLLSSFGAVVLVLHLLASAVAAQEPSEPIESARAHFKLGVDFYRERNYRAALIEFQRAYAASPHYKLLYNLGQASLELQEDSNGIDYFTRYLREGAAEISDERKAEVQENIARLRARLATITVTTNQAGAEIYVDETRIGVAPLSEPVKVSVGRRRFVAVKQGLPDAERVIDVAAGDQLAVELEFKDRPQELDIASLEKALNAKQEDSGPSAALITGLGTGGVAVAATTFSILTMIAQRQYDDELQVETTPEDLERLRDDANTKALVADILWGATAVGAGVTVVLMLTEGGEEREPSVKLNVSPMSVRLSGKF